MREFSWLEVCASSNISCCCTLHFLHNSIEFKNEFVGWQESEVIFPFCDLFCCGSSCLMFVNIWLDVFLSLSLLRRILSFDVCYYLVGSFPFVTSFATDPDASSSRLMFVNIWLDIFHASTEVQHASVFAPAGAAGSAGWSVASCVTDRLVANPAGETMSRIPQQGHCWQGRYCDV
jgi:hypothetical protein